MPGRCRVVDPRQSASLVQPLGTQASQTAAVPFAEAMGETVAVAALRVGFEQPPDHRSILPAVDGERGSVRHVVIPLCR
ncbi:hypothetical protein ACKI16_45505 [Streptomyces scabiei]